MKRHISIFAFLLGAFAATVPAMAMNVYGVYYCKPGETEYIYSDDETYIEPSIEFVYSDCNNPLEVRAKPEKGWSVDSWYVANQAAPAGYPWSGEKISGVDGTCPFFALTGLVPMSSSSLASSSSISRTT